MTRIRFKGSPLRCGISAPAGAPLGTSLIIGLLEARSTAQTHCPLVPADAGTQTLPQVEHYFRIPAFAGISGIGTRSLQTYTFTQGLARHSAFCAGTRKRRLLLLGDRCDCFGERTHHGLEDFRSRRGNGV